MRVQVHDSRRLTGPNLLLDGPGSTLDARCDDDVDVEGLVDAWEDEVTSRTQALGLEAGPLASRRWQGGLSVAVGGPIDALYTLCEVNEGAFVAACARVGADVDLEPPTTDPAVELAAERDPRWLALQRAASERGVPFLWDDDEHSVGLGEHATTWPVDELPSPEDVVWDAAQAVPVVMVTGTNGKSTTVRLVAAVLARADVAVGLTSTDGIVVRGEVVEAGDFSGPGGARTLLRHPQVGAAVLEVARGGLLRRGLPVDRADVAVVTNVSDDHLGEYGVETLDDLAQAKLLVGRAVDEDGLLVLNADDPLLVRHAPGDVPIGWFTLDPDAEHVARHVAGGGTAWTVVDGVVVERRAGRETPIVRVDQVPVTYDGAARHNVANVLAAVAVARRLGVQRALVVEGLRGFRGDADDNPGRANRFVVDGAEVIVDFAHNPAGMRAIAEMVSRIPARRRLVLFGQAGDRSDAAIRELAGVVWDTSPDRVIAVDVPHYLRGREEMEVPGIVVDELLSRGADPAVVTTARSPAAGVEQALAWVQPGDLLLLMVLEGRDEALELIASRAV